MRKIVASRSTYSLWNGTDFIAHYDGEEEAGGYGYGATEAEAIRDFIDNCQEWHDERLGEGEQ